MPNPCDKVLEQGIFDTSSYYNDATYQDSLDTWFYYSEFRTHQDALDAGLSVGFPVYGVPIKIGGTFSTDQVEAWKKEHAGQVKAGVSLHEAHAAALKKADPGIINGWVECQKIQGKIQENAYGLIAGIRAVGKTYVYFWIQYRPPVAGVEAKISSFQATGINDPDQPIKVGQTIPIALEGLGGTYNITDKANVSFTVQTVNTGTVNVTFRPADYEEQVANQQNQETTLASAGAIVGEVRIFAFSPKDSVTKSAIGRRGWLECDGRILNVLEYPELYQAIGTAWGSPAPNVAFNVPDLRGMFLRGWDHGSTHDPGAPARMPRTPGGSTGDQVGSFQDQEVGSHNHDASFSNINAGNKSVTLCNSGQPPSSGVGGAIESCGSRGYQVGVIVSPSGGETRPINVAVAYFIYAGRPIETK